jgi:hypothetical protein
MSDLAAAGGVLASKVAGSLPDHAVERLADASACTEARLTSRRMRRRERRWAIGRFPHSHLWALPAWLGACPGA